MVQYKSSLKQKGPGLPIPAQFSLYLCKAPLIIHPNPHPCKHSEDFPSSKVCIAQHHPGGTDMCCLGEQHAGLLKATRGWIYYNVNCSELVICPQDVPKVGLLTPTHCPAVPGGRRWWLRLLSSPCLVVPGSGLEVSAAQSSQHKPSDTRLLGVQMPWELSPSTSVGRAPPTP